MSSYASASPLGPMTFGQILDRIFRLMRVHWRLFLGIALVPTLALIGVIGVPMGCMYLAVSPQIVAKPGVPPHIPVYAFSIFFLVCYPLTLAIFVLYMAAGSYAATQANLGVEVTFKQSYGVAWRQFGRFLWLGVLVALYVLVPTLVVAALIGGGALLIGHGAQRGMGTGALVLLIPAAVLAYIGLLIYCVMIMLRFAVAFPACVAEDLSAGAALRRSAGLTCGGRGRIFLVLLVVYAATYAVNIAGVTAMFFLGAVGGFVAVSAHVTAGSPAFYILIGLAIALYLFVMLIYASFTYAAMNAAIAVLYHDQRLRKDGIAPVALPA
jgi:hypothetical protein